MSNNLSYKLHLFGAGQLTRSDGKDCTPRLKKAVGILAYLAVAKGQPVARAKLQNLFWEDSPQKQGRESLKACLSQLRQCFSDMAENPIRSSGGPVSLCMDRIECDLFSQSARDGLYHPAFLDGIDFNEETAEDWLRFMRCATAPEETLTPTIEQNGTKEVLLHISKSLERLAGRLDQDGHSGRVKRIDNPAFQLSLSTNGNAVELRFSELSRPA